MFYNHKFFFILSAAAAVSLGTACSFMDKTESSESKTADQPAATPAVQPAPASPNASLKPAMTFAQTDVARIKARTNDASFAKLTDEQKKIDAEVNKKYIPLREAYRKKSGDSELKALEKLLSDPRISPAMRVQILLMIAEHARINHNYKRLTAVVDKALKGEYGQLQSSSRAVLLNTRAFSYENQQKKYAEAANDLLKRLAENVDEKDLFAQQRRIVQLYRRDAAFSAASSLAKEMITTRKLSDIERPLVWNDLLDIARDCNDAAFSQELARFILVCEKDPKASGYLHNLMILMDRQKMKTELDALRESIIKDPAAPMGARLEVFYDKARPIAQNERSNKRRIYYLLGNTIFKKYKKNPFYDKPLIENAAAEDAARQNEDLRWIIDAMKNAKLTPVQFAALANYLKRYASAGGINMELNKAIMAYPGMPGPEKVGPYGAFINAALDKGDFATANKLADEAEKLDGLQPGSDAYINAMCYKAQILRVQDRCDDAVAHMRAKMGKDKSNKWQARLRGMYSAFARTEDVINVQIEFGDKAGALNTMASRWPDKAKAWADRVIPDEKEKIDFRRFCIKKYYFGNNPAALAMQKKYPDLAKFDNPGDFVYGARNAITMADYGKLQWMIDGWKRTAPKPNFERVEMKLQMYAVARDNAKLNELAKYVAEQKEFNDDQKRLVAFCAGALCLPDKKGEIERYSKDFPEKKLTGAQRAALLKRTAVLALNARKFVLSEDAYKLREALFKPEPKKLYTLKFSDTPIFGYAGFMQVAGNAEKQYLDRKFGGNMDFLVTDVSTGSRSDAIGKDKKETYRPTVMQAACDENGIHLLFTAFDPKTRDIEAGTAGAGSFEMYFSPGEDQPYYCFLPNLTTGTNHIWDSTYTNPQFRRIDNGRKKQQIRSERTFTKDGYVLYMFISWEPFYDKLPDPGDRWDFENVHWSRFGGYSWNGIKTVHGRSTWGKLTFRITPEQMLKIKRKIIYAAKRNYQAEKVTNASVHGVIDIWKKDPVLGDPDFYKKEVDPLVRQLDSRIGDVKADMTPETIDTLYRDFVPGWFEIRYKIGELRTRYLENSFTD